MLALGGLMVHAFFDGVALAAPAETERGVSVLALAVAIHRLPVAITTWALVRPSYGTLLAVAILAGDVIAVICGYAVESSAGLGSEPAWVHYFEALVGGSLMHVLIHRPTLSRPHGGVERAIAGLAGVAAVAAVAALAREDFEMHVGSDGLGAADYFVTLARQAAPALLAAYVLASLAQVLVPRATAGWLRGGGGRGLGAAARGIGFGLTQPVCSCGVAPAYRALIPQGVAAAAAMAFLVATPQLGLDAILLTVPLLGGELAIARMVAAVAVAIVIGVVVGRLAAPATPAAAAADDHAPAGGLLARVRAGLHFGFAEVVDHTGPWILVGLAIAAVMAPLVDAEWIAGLPWGVDVLLLALIGMPLYVSGSGATPLVAVLVLKGLSPGAAVAFLVTGTAINTDTYRMLAELHGRAAAVRFVAVLGLVAVAIGLAVNGVLEQVTLWPTVEVRGWVGDVALYGMAAVFALSMLRQGPRGFMDQIIDPYDKHHDHDHHHSEGHTAEAEAVADHRH
jgi:uncharacterized membrane protein YraQ (UPF0718 family)